MNPDDLKAVQRAGWAIVAADQEAVMVKCPSEGCGLSARLKPRGGVPQRDVPGHSLGKVVSCFEDVRDVMKNRRMDLGLTIAEVEHISGIASDHLAKFEKTEWYRQPSMDIVTAWTGALGVDMVLRPGELPPITMRWIADTRPKFEERRKRFEVERRRDPLLRRPRDLLEAERARLLRQQAFIARQIEEVETKIRERNQGVLFAEWEFRD